MLLIQMMLQNTFVGWTLLSKYVYSSLKVLFVKTLKTLIISEIVFNFV